MKLTIGQRLICDRAINVIETGTVDGEYGAISIYHDGPHKMRQVTYGRSQTTEYGNLGKLVRMYCDAKGTYSEAVKPYRDLVGHVALVDNATFKDLLRKAGNEDAVMKAVQDRFFDETYFEPARKWAETNGFALPLSMLVIYDSFIHSGGILSFLRTRFAEVTPKKGGSEQVWIQQYVEVRNHWLSTHSNSDLVASAYRTRDLLREIVRGNWNLALIPILINGTPVSDKQPTKKATVAAIPGTPADALTPYLGTFDERDLAVGQPDVKYGARTVTTASRTEILRKLAVVTGTSPAMERLLNYRDAYSPGSNPRYWAVVDFNLHSSKPRLFVFDSVAEQVDAYLCAHGKGSDQDNDGMATVFSNQDGSHCSALGIYRCDLTYTGEHGKSLYLDGMEATNSAARARHIVMHGAGYVSQNWIGEHGQLGRSWGCPAIELDKIEAIIPKLMGGSFMVHWKT